MRRVVMANGCFDLFHIGHLRYLKEASKLGDWLCVTVTRNENVNKGPDRPLYDEWDRLEIVKDLWFVHDAFITPSVMFALKWVRPSVFVKGSEYKGKIDPEHQAYCQENGIEIAFTDTEVVRPRDRLRQD